MAMFTLRHRGLIGGGKEDITHIAKVIVLNMVFSPLLTLNTANFVLFLILMCFFTAIDAPKVLN